MATTSPLVRYKNVVDPSVIAPPEIWWRRPFLVAHVIITTITKQNSFWCWINPPTLRTAPIPPPSPFPSRIKLLFLRNDHLGAGAHSHNVPLLTKRTRPPEIGGLPRKDGRPVRLFKTTTIKPSVNISTATCRKTYRSVGRLPPPLHRTTT